MLIRAETVNRADARNYDQMKAVIDQVMQDFGRIDGW